MLLAIMKRYLSKVHLQVKFQQVNTVDMQPSGQITNFVKCVSAFYKCFFKLVAYILHF